MAMEVLEQFELQDQVPVIGLAKQHEEIFKPGRRRSIRLNPAAPALLLLQRIRDEAHRFAITYHRKRRRKRGLASQLDEIPGIGPVRRRTLLKTLGSLDAIQKASKEALMEVPGISEGLASEIRLYFDQLQRERNEES